MDLTLSFCIQSLISGYICLEPWLELTMEQYQMIQIVMLPLDRTYKVLAMQESWNSIRYDYS